VEVAAAAHRASYALSYSGPARVAAPSAQQVVTVT
jgi:hypothetical protein